MAEETKEVPLNVKEEFAQVAEDGDPIKFRAFCRKYEEYGDKLQFHRFIHWSDKKIKHFLLWWTATRPEFAERWEYSRNLLRVELLEKELSFATPELKEYLKTHDDYPICQNCVYLTKPTEGQTLACIHRGAMPADICCAGWTKRGDQ